MKKKEKGEWTDLLYLPGKRVLEETDERSFCLVMMPTSEESPKFMTTAQ